MFVLLNRRFAGAERGSRVSQFVRNALCGRMRATERAPRDRFHLLERIYGLADLIERGAGVMQNCLRIQRPRRERKCMILPENTSRHAY